MAFMLRNCKKLTRRCPRPEGGLTAGPVKPHDPAPTTDQGAPVQSPIRWKWAEPWRSRVGRARLGRRRPGYCIE
jgi:hypothetical protein